MLWHIVEFRFPNEVSDSDRAELEARIRGLTDHIEELRFLRIARAIDDPAVTGLITGFDDQAGLDAYNTHPEHKPVVERVRGLGLEVRRLDLETGDKHDALPLTED